MRRAFRTKLRVLASILLVIGLFLVVRLYFVQVIHGSDFALRAQRQYISSSQQLYDRGAIYFTRKDNTPISAATLETGFMIAVHPQEIKNPEEVYTKLSAVIPLTQSTVIAQLSKPNDVYEVLAHHVSDADGQTISAMSIPGVLVERERWRVYPAGTQAAQTLGFIAYNSDNVYTGQAGLESYYNSVLDRSAQGLFGNFFAELFANLDNVVVDARSARQGDLITSIEPMLEQKLDQELKAVNDQYHSTETGGIIMDPKTGEILALDSYPTFDPNDFRNGDPQYFGNPIIQHEYEFGSIVKALTMASGLDAGVINKDSTYNDTGCIHPNGRTVCNYDLKARGVIPMKEILDQSLNVGASYIADKLGHDRMRTYFTKLGLGEKTNLDLPGEVTGKLKNLSTNQDVNYDNAAFGQGISVTPIEMIRALGALANNGAIVSPHIVRGIQFETGVTRNLNWGKPVQVFNPQFVNQVGDMLTQVYINDAKLEISQNPGLQMAKVGVAAKTGTAQVVDVSTGKYYKNIYFHSFMGYFPTRDPKFVILLYTNRPQGVQYASRTLTKSFMDLTNFLINYYNIPPDSVQYANGT